MLLLSAGMQLVGLRALLLRALPLARSGQSRGLPFVACGGHGIRLQRLRLCRLA